MHDLLVCEAALVVFCGGLKLQGYEVLYHGKWISDPKATLYPRVL